MPCCFTRRPKGAYGSIDEPCVVQTSTTSASIFGGAGGSQHRSLETIRVCQPTTRVLSTIPDTGFGCLHTSSSVVAVELPRRRETESMHPDLQSSCDLAS